jgi:hypothetical protein
MLVITVILIIIGLLYFPSKMNKQKQLFLGKMHMENLDRLDLFSRATIEKWVDELNSELGENQLSEEALWNIIGLKIKNAKYDDHLEGKFKPINKETAAQLKDLKT